jgi:hypothetical protein
MTNKDNKWEYYQYVTESWMPQAILINLGEEKWELIAVVPMMASDKSGKIYYFKRPLK